MHKTHLQAWSGKNRSLTEYGITPLRSDSVHNEFSYLWAVLGKVSFKSNALILRYSLKKKQIMLLRYFVW